MNTLKSKVLSASTKSYLFTREAVRKVVFERKGASTVEYVVVLGAAAALAGILYSTLKGQKKTIQDAVNDAFKTVK